MATRRLFNLIVLIYLLVGIYIAWIKNYITVSLLKNVLSALLAILLWFLVLLHVDLHVH